MDNIYECITIFQNGIEVGDRKEFVRCNDCKNYDRSMLYCNKFGIEDIDDDWFCADGVKRE